MMWSMEDREGRVVSLARGYVLFLCHALNVTCQFYTGFIQRCKKVVLCHCRQSIIAFAACLASYVLEDTMKVLTPLLPCKLAPSASISSEKSRNHSLPSSVLSKDMRVPQAKSLTFVLLVLPFVALMKTPDCL